MTGLIIFLAVVVVLLILLTPMGRAFLQVIKNLFVQDVLSNPKMAEGAYLAEIERAKKTYSKAADACKEVTGLLRETERKLEKLTTELSDTERRCESFARSGDEEGLRLVAAQRASLVTQKTALERQVVDLQPIVEAAKEAQQEAQREVKQLETEKSTKIAELVTQKTMNDVYDRMDKIRAQVGTTRLTEQVDANIEKYRRQAIGGKEAFENNIDTQTRRVNERLANREADDYVTEMMNKYKRAN